MQKNKQYVIAYKKNNIHRLNLGYSKEDAKSIKDFCKKMGIPVNTFIKQSISKKIEKEGICVEGGFHYE